GGLRGNRSHWGKGPQTLGPERGKRALGRGGDRGRDQAAAGCASSGVRGARRGQGNRASRCPAAQDEPARRGRDQSAGWKDCANVRGGSRMAGGDWLLDRNAAWTEP